jgi:hypothetical protein
MIHEASAFQVNLKNIWDATEWLSHVLDAIPIYVVFGEKVDFMQVVQ